MYEKLKMIKQEFEKLGYSWNNFKIRSIILDSKNKRISIVNTKFDKHWICYSYDNEDKDDYSGSVTPEEHKLINELLIELGWYPNCHTTITEIKSIAEGMAKFSNDLDSEFYELRGRILELCDEILEKH